MSNSPLSAHPFELAGMGTGPFGFVGMVSIPSATLAEQNPSAYQNALGSLPHDLEGGLGTCRCCGQAITHVCIIENAQGDRYGVGTDCVLKTDDPCLANKAKIAVAKLQRKQRFARAAAKREAHRQKWLSTACDEAGETNAQRIERERTEQEAAQKARKDAVWAKFGFLLPYLGGPEGGFCASIAAGIREGQAPRGRALDICGEIYAKAHGRRGSNAYVEALNEFNDKTWEAA
jgi:hypothetical protein